MMNSMILNSMAFLDWQADSAAFWILLALAILFYFSGVKLRDDAPIKSIALNLLSAAVLFLYSGTAGEAFWFINLERQNLIAWFFCYILTAIFFGILIGMTIVHFKLLLEIFSDFWVALIGVIIGCIWGCLLLRYVGIIFEEHPVICFLTIFGAISSGSASHVPTIYVRGEGHITGRGYNGGSSFHGDNGYDYDYDGSNWHRS